MDEIVPVLGLLIPILGVIFVIGVPVLAFATRFALRPLLRDLAEVRGSRTQDGETVQRLTERVASLEREALERDARLNELAEAELFRRQLEAPAEAGNPQDTA